MDTVNKIIKSSTVFYNDLKKDPNGRYRSWEHCYNQFGNARYQDQPDVDILSLHLAFYLASWGMYRGSSFILQKDYLVHVPAFNIILEGRYDCLYGCECGKLKDVETQNKLMELVARLSEYYSEVRESVKETDVKSSLSSTLITKILMGTMGCVPAYDRYFIDGIKRENVSTGNFNIRSLLKIVDFYEVNYKRLEETRKNMDVYGKPYPQMKLLDMGFWQVGFDADDKKGIKIAR